MLFADYLAIDALNWSTLKVLAKSPKKFKHALTHPIEDRPRLAIGRAVHTRALEPARWNDEYGIFPADERRGTNYWKAFVAASEGKTVLKSEEVDLVDAMVEALFDDESPARPLLEGDGYNEHVITWTEPTTGKRCKARLDRVKLGGRDEALIDLKTCADVAPRHFGNTAAKMLYHRQLAWYLEGWKLWCREQGLAEIELQPTLVCVEMEAPHEVAVYHLDDEQLYAARDANNELLAKLVECERTGKWPGVAPEPQPLLLPAWEYFTEDGGADELGLDLDGLRNEENAA